jgi:hypothetical protein
MNTTEVDLFEEMLPTSDPEPALPEEHGGKVRAGDVMALLRRQYPDGAYALLEQVRNATGYGKQERYADALVMSCWPSRGLWLAGIEVKVDRRDWLNEYANAAKAEAIAQFCDYWWLVAGSDKVAREDEIPERWGFKVVRGGKLITVKDAPKLDAKPMERAFLASVLRNSVGLTQAAQEERIRNEAHSAGYAAGVEAGKESGKWERERWEQEATQLEERVRRFEELSGVRIDGYDGDRIAAAVRTVLDGTRAADAVRREMERTRDALRRMLDRMDRELGATP